MHLTRPLACVSRRASSWALPLVLAVAGLSHRVADAQGGTPSTQWTGTTTGAWSTSANWDSGVPNAGTNAIITSSGASITLGAGAAANTLFVQGPNGGQSFLSSGTLTLTDQLWINVDSPAGTTLWLDDAGSSPVSVTASKVTVGADFGKQGSLILSSATEGSVTLQATDSLTIGYAGDGSSVSTYPRFGSPAGSASITAGTIQLSVTDVAGQVSPNSLSTDNTGHTLTTGTLNIGVEGMRGIAQNSGGTWTVGSTALGIGSGAAANELRINESGTFTNTGAFTVGQQGFGNTVSVGWGSELGTPGALVLTGANDLVVGSGTASTANTLAVAYDGSSLSVNGNLVVGLYGSSSTFTATNLSTVTSVGARLGVDAASSLNSVTVSGGATWTMNGTVRVGDKGSLNSFQINNGSAVVLTGSGKNFYVGYEKSASLNTLAVSGSGSTLQMHDASADLVISANQGAGATKSTGNQADVSYGGTLDVTRVLVGDGGTLSGDEGIVTGDTIVVAGGVLSPGALGSKPLGSLSFLSNVDLSLSGGGTFAVDLGPSGNCDVITVSGTFSIANSTLAVSAGVPDASQAYVIAHYGTLLGTFATVTGLPSASWHVEYNYKGLNEIAIVSDAVSVPEIDPASFGGGLALLLGSLGLLEKRSRRIRGRHHLPTNEGGSAAW